MSCSYVQTHYGVPAEVGRRVKVYGKPGIIAADRGHYIGVTFDEDKPGVVRNAHPTDGVEYMEMGTPRRLTKAQARYARYLTCRECFDSFIDFCRYDSGRRSVI